jgi:NAD(P)H-dependent FMN reductase
LSVDHGLRPLFASLGATVVSAGVYATPDQFQDGVAGPELREALERAVQEAERIGGSTK